MKKITIIATLLVLMSLVLGLAGTKQQSKSTQSKPTTEPPWAEILGSSQGSLPQPRDSVIWQSDLNKAMREAQDEGRPLFVTMRCLPCKQCADFDKDVLEGGSDLDPLLTQFVTVRLTDAGVFNLNLFPIKGFQDLDLSWWGWLMSPKGEVYSIFGGRDEVSDTTRISKEALINTLDRVLKHHYDPRRAKWGIEGAAPNLEAERTYPKQLPGYEAWYEGAHPEVKQQECLHCHQIIDILRQPEIDSGRFDKNRDLDMWPLPENVGISVDRDHGLLVTKVEPESPASKAGIQAGDVLAMAANRKLFGQADFRGVLHREPRGNGQINIRWLHEGKLMAGVLQVKEGWRQTVLDWRTSVAGGNFGIGPGFWPLGASAQQRRNRGIETDAMAVKPWFGKNQSGVAFGAGLRHSDIIIAVDGESPNLIGRSFLVWFRLNHERGDQVIMSVINQRGETRKVTYKLDG